MKTWKKHITKVAHNRRQALSIWRKINIYIKKLGTLRYIYFVELTEERFRHSWCIPKGVIHVYIFFLNPHFIEFSQAFTSLQQELEKKRSAICCKFKLSNWIESNKMWSFISNFNVKGRFESKSRRKVPNW